MKAKIEKSSTWYRIHKDGKMIWANVDEIDKVLTIGNNSLLRKSPWNEEGRTFSFIKSDKETVRAIGEMLIEASKLL